MDKSSQIAFIFLAAVSIAVIVLLVVVYIFSLPSESREYLVCDYYGRTYQDGENFAADDGCNTCFCENGVVACTEIACGEIDEEVSEISESTDGV